MDDLALGYLRAVESGVGQEVFHFAEEGAATFREVVLAIAEAAGRDRAAATVETSRALELWGDMAEIYRLDLVLDSSKARRQLNWAPAHETFLSGAPIYLEAWKAWHSVEA